MSGEPVEEVGNTPAAAAAADVTVGPAAIDAQSPPAPPGASRLFGRLEEFAKHAKLVLALLAALVYGVVRVAVEAFYQEFQLSPDDLGISQTQLLGRAGLFLVLFVAVLVAIVACTGALALRIIELVGGLTADAAPDATGVEAHDHARGTLAAGVWGLALLLAALPAILSFLAPELVAFLLGQSRPDDPSAAILRMSAAAWSGSLGLVVVLAMRATCRWWNRLRNKPEWLRRSIVVFVPSGLAAPFALIVQPDRRTGFLRLVEWLLLSSLVLCPVVVAIWRTVHWKAKRPRGGWPAVDRLGASAVASSLLFCVLLAPLLIAVLDDDAVTARFAPGPDLLRKSNAAYSARLHLLLPLLPLALALAFAVLVALAAVRLGGCAAHRDRRRSEGSSSLAGALGIICVVAFAVLLLADERGRVLAERVRAGDRLRPWAGLVLAYAEPVCVLGVDELRTPGPWMLIGEVSDRLVLHDPLDGRIGTRRSGPEDDVTMQVPKNSASLLYLNRDVLWNEGRAEAAETCKQAGTRFTSNGAAAPAGG
ncbi:MAG: hypothetical protein ACR2MO_15915 [Acidimicrobiales bacterium]